MGKAVTRNRAKRLVREGYRLAEDKLQKGYDFVVVVRSSIAGKKLKHVYSDMLYAIKKLDLGITAETLDK